MIFDKLCARCREVKLSTEFNRSSRTKDECRYECRECQKKDYLLNRQNRLVKIKEYTRNHPEKRKEILKRWNIKAVDYKRSWRQKKFYSHVIEMHYRGEIREVLV